MEPASGPERSDPDGCERRDVPGKPGGGVQALDAVNGDLLWEFRTPRNTQRAVFPLFRDRVPDPGDAPASGAVRNLALYADKVYTVAGTRVIALNARTGAVAWDRQINDRKLGYRHTAGPIAVKGKIVIGSTGCDWSQAGWLRHRCPPC